MREKEGRALVSCALAMLGSSESAIKTNNRDNRVAATLLKLKPNPPDTP